MNSISTIKQYNEIIVKRILEHGKGIRLLTKEKLQMEKLIEKDPLSKYFQTRFKVIGLTKYSKNYYVIRLLKRGYKDRMGDYSIVINELQNQFKMMITSIGTQQKDHITLHLQRIKLK